MNLLNPGVQYLAISDPTNDQVVFINGSDISPSSTLEKEVLTRGISSAGNATQLNVKWDLSLQFADETSFNTLKALPNTSTYRVTIVKFDGFVFWNEDRSFMLDEAFVSDPESEDYPYTIRMTDIRSNPDIQQKLNAVAPFEDKDNDGEVDGFTFSTSSTTSFTAGVQSVTTDDDVNVYKRLYLPLAGKKFTYSFFPVNGTLERFIRYLDVNETEISIDAINMTPGTLHVKEITIPANTYYVDIGVTAGFSFGADTYEFRDISLRPQSSDFVNY